MRLPVPFGNRPAGGVTREEYSGIKAAGSVRSTTVSSEERLFRVS